MLVKLEFGQIDNKVTKISELKIVNFIYFYFQT